MQILDLHDRHVAGEAQTPASVGEQHYLVNPMNRLQGCQVKNSKAI